MSSSPTPARAAQSDTSRLLEVFASIPDPRKRRGIRHRLPVILALGLAAVVAGARSFVAISDWVSDAGEDTLNRLGADPASRPTESTIRRVFTRLDPTVLDRVIGAFIWTRTRIVGGRRVIALDGKTIRGARTNEKAAPHLVAAFDHGTGTVIGQLATAAKSNEIPCVTTLLAVLDLADVVVTVDAMHTQTDTAKAIIDGGGHYVFTVKGNQKKLHQAIKALPWKQVPGHRVTTTSHGRRATRTIKVVTAPDWIGFHGAAQVAQLRRTVTRAGKKSVEVVYVITSASHAEARPATLATWVQGHWGIENRLHWVRDVTYDEDRSQVRTGHGPHVMATLRNTAISLLRLAGWDSIATALRRHAANPQRLLNLLLTC